MVIIMVMVKVKVNKRAVKSCSSCLVVTKNSVLSDYYLSIN